MINSSELKDLVGLFNHGDPVAFKSIYKNLFPDLFDFTIKIIRNREEAEDIVAESFFKLWEKRENFSTIQNIDAFLHVTCKNACVDRMRHSKVEMDKRDVLLEDIIKNNEEGIEEPPLKNALLNRIYAEMEKLPSKSRDVILLSYLKNLKNTEIARVLGTTEKTVRNQKVSALKRLRATILNKWST